VASPSPAAAPSTTPSPSPAAAPYVPPEPKLPSCPPKVSKCLSIALPLSPAYCRVVSPFIAHTCVGGCCFSSGKCTSSSCASAGLGAAVPSVTCSGLNAAGTIGIGAACRGLGCRLAIPGCTSGSTGASCVGTVVDLFGNVTAASAPASSALLGLPCLDVAAGIKPVEYDGSAAEVGGRGRRSHVRRRRVLLARAGSRLSMHPHADRPAARSPTSALCSPSSLCASLLSNSCPQYGHYVAKTWTPCDCNGTAATALDRLLIAVAATAAPTATTSTGATTAAATTAATPAASNLTGLAALVASIKGFDASHPLASLLSAANIDASLPSLPQLPAANVTNALALIGSLVGGGSPASSSASSASSSNAQLAAVLNLVKGASVLSAASNSSNPLGTVLGALAAKRLNLTNPLGGLANLVSALSPSVRARAGRWIWWGLCVVGPCEQGHRRKDPRLRRPRAWLQETPPAPP
jgi:hypothetical protein